MSRQLARLRHTFLLVVLLVALVAVTSAQGGGRIVISYVELDERGEETLPQTLSLTFTVFNEDNTIDTQQPTGGTLTILETGQRVNVEIERASVPLNIVLMMDASGSMFNAADALREAAVIAVNNTPEDTSFSINQFNVPTTQLQGFTRDRSLLLLAVQNYAVTSLPNPNAFTCLYDGLLESVRATELGAVQSRRAVIFFTDGVNTPPPNRPDACSQDSPQEALTLARERGIPIYTIGLRGDGINEGELNSIAVQTGGVFVVANNPSELTDVFRTIANALRSQWTAEAELCLPTGNFTGALSIEKERSALIPSNVQFPITRQCIPPEEATVTPTGIPLTLSVEGFQFRPDEEIAAFSVRRSGGTGNLSDYLVQINALPSREELTSFTQAASAENVQRLEFSTEGFAPGEIEIIVTGLTRAEEVLFRTDGNRFGVQRPSTPTPSPTATTPPVGVNVNSLSYSQDEDTITLRLTTFQTERIANLQIDIVDDNTNINVRPAEVLDVSNEILLDVSDLVPNQRYLVRLTIISNDGEQVPPQEVQFTYQPLQTPTPTPSATPVPVSATIDSITYDPSTDLINLSVTFIAADRVNDFRVDVAQRSTNLVVATYTPDLQRDIVISTDRLEPGETYVIRLVLQSPEGRVQISEEITYSPPLTPTATPTPAPTATPTPAAIIGAIRLSDDIVTVELDVNNPGEIASYRVRVVNAGGVQVGANITINTPPFDSVTFSLDDIGAGAGEYQVEIVGLNAAGASITPLTVREFTYNPPPPPTATAAPGLFGRVTEAARSNPLIAVMIFVAFLLLLFLLGWLVRQGRQDRYRPIVANPGATEVFDAAEVRRQLASGGTSQGQAKPGAQQIITPPAAQSGGDATIIEERGNPDATLVDAVVTPQLPRNVSATLYIKSSEDATMVNQRIPLTMAMFTIGRRNANLEINDPRVSRNHAMITYDPQQAAFYLQDLQSGGGTYLNGVKLNPNEPVPLPNDSVIQLGANTEIKFVSEEQTYLGMDK